MISVKRINYSGSKLAIKEVARVVSSFEGRTLVWYEYIKDIYRVVYLYYSVYKTNYYHYLFKKKKKSFIIIIILVLVLLLLYVK